jgi:pyroglutamyl-peptidase
MLSAMRERTLVTGFGPFGEVTDNPSARLAEGCGRPFQVLEVSYRAVDGFLEMVQPSSFDRLVMLGVAAGREWVTPELFARNRIGARKDVSGAGQAGEIEPGGPLLLEGNLWTPEALSGLLIKTQIEVSLNAGTYLCNYIYYRALSRFPDRNVGFLHVPPVDKIALERQIVLVEKCLAACEAP